MLKGLTKQDLINWGITVEEQDGKYVITRVAMQTGFCRNLVKRELVFREVKRVHKYGKDKSYLATIISVDGKAKSLLLSRVLYAWFKGDIPDGYDVDHIDNNSMNNSLDNLQLLTREENLKKRGLGRNQHNVDWSEDKIRTYRDLISKRDELLVRRKELKAQLEYYEDEYVYCIGNKMWFEAYGFELKIKDCRKEIRNVIDTKREVLRQLKELK